MKKNHVRKKQQYLIAKPEETHPLIHVDDLVVSLGLHPKEKCLWNKKVAKWKSIQIVTVQGQTGISRK